MVEAGPWYRKKVHLFRIYADKIQVLSSKTQQVRYMHAYEDIMGVTTSMNVGSKNFIIHFRGQADEEWNSQAQREAIISTLGERFKTSEARVM